MNVQKAVHDIDKEIEKRVSDYFGIKMGSTLYGELFNSGFVTIEKFAITGTTLFEQGLPAYRGKYGVYMDPGMPDEAFDVGVPD